MIAMADCRNCGARMPAREAFSTDQMIIGAFATRYEPLEGPCTCGGTLREDMTSTLNALLHYIEESDPE